MEAFTLNVGRGDVYFENSSYDDADGAGVTIRSSSNPATGSMFAVRSSGHAARLWVGQSITTPGINDLYVGYSGSSGDEGTTSSYKHKLTSTISQFGTITTWSSDDRLKDNEELIELYQFQSYGFCNTPLHHYHVLLN